MKRKIVKKKKNLFFFLFFFIFLQNRAILSRGTSRDRGSCPGIFAAALVPGQRDSGTRKLFLSRDKGTAGQGNFFVPGQRDNGTSRPLETLIQTNLYIWDGLFVRLVDSIFWLLRVLLIHILGSPLWNCWARQSLQQTMFKEDQGLHENGLFLVITVNRYVNKLSAPRWWLATSVLEGNRKLTEAVSRGVRCCLQVGLTQFVLLRGATQCFGLDTCDESTKSLH